MPARVAALFALIAALGGCLRVFGPDLRARGVHAVVTIDDKTSAGSCMGCHESEADALARLTGRVHQHGDSPAHTHPGEPAAMPTSPSPAMAEGPPLVADWMVADARPCTSCHRVRP